MAITTIDGITTRYEVVGSGPPLLMFSPGGFDATLDKWTTLGIYARIRILDHLLSKYSCIIFDRRESGQSGGRVEPLTWKHYVTQGKGLLDHLNIKRARLMGGCMGCSPALALGVSHSEVVQSLILFWPAGGAKYRINCHSRFAEHLSFVRQQGLEQVVSLAKAEGKMFGADPRVGPWASVIRNDAAFAASYARQSLDEYCAIVTKLSRSLFDRDTISGAEPEDLLQLKLPTLIIPGNDASHATSGARYLAECLPGSEYWDAPVPDQTEQAASSRILEFLSSHEIKRTGSE
jgi:pimeloyl-ACP methyl ester carboxylesterase